MERWGKIIVTDTLEGHVQGVKGIGVHQYCNTLVEEVEPKDQLEPSLYDSISISLSPRSGRSFSLAFDCSFYICCVRLFVNYPACITLLPRLLGFLYPLNYPAWTEHRDISSFVRRCLSLGRHRLGCGWVSPGKLVNGDQPAQLKTSQRRVEKGPSKRKQP